MLISILNFLRDYCYFKQAINIIKHSISYSQWINLESANDYALKSAGYPSECRILVTVGGSKLVNNAVDPSECLILVIDGCSVVAQYNAG